MLNARPVEGFFRRLRWAADGILIAILLAIPWIRIGGEPLVLLDVPNRKFHVFGLVIFPQELYFLWLILAGLALSLFFFTALAGRLWCGWACPQTVFTDVYAWIAARVEGWSKAGRPAHVPLWRTIVLHAIWLVLSFVLGFHVVSYFVGPYELIARFESGDLGKAGTGFLIVATALAYFDFVILRQTFCKYLCPYARFQGVLFDSDTLVVGYDPVRGEPRGKRAVASPEGGDCVDCGLCVAVCPTDIDIRKGLQLECIACTACIDACNGVMAKIGRPRNLIGYRSLVSLEQRRPARLVRPRVVIYATLVVLIGATFATALARRVPLDFYVSHNQSSLVGTSADGRSSNAYVLHIQNRDRRDHVLRVRLEAPEEYELLAGVNPIAVLSTDDVEARVFVLRNDREHVEREEEEEGGVHPGAHSLRFVVEQVGPPHLAVARDTTFIEKTGAGLGASGGAH